MVAVQVRASVSARLCQLRGSFAGTHSAIGSKAYTAVTATERRAASSPPTSVAARLSGEPSTPMTTCSTGAEPLPGTIASGPGSVVDEVMGDAAEVQVQEPSGTTCADDEQVGLMFPVRREQRVGRVAVDQEGARARGERERRTPLVELLPLLVVAERVLVG